MPACGVAICESLKWHPRDFATLKERMVGSDWLTVFSSPTLCSDIDQVRSFVSQSGLSSLAIVGYNDREALAKVAKAAEHTGLPRYSIQVVPLQVYQLKEDGIMGETWAIAAATHARKASAASFAARAKRNITRDLKVGRRELLFSLPRIIGEPVEDPVMVPERCSPFHSACRLCSEACHYSAISHDGSVAAIDPTRCVHCGACAAVCPSGALQSPIFSDDEFRALLREFEFRTARFEYPLLLFTCEEGIAALEAEAKSGLGLREGMVAVRSPCAAPLGWPHYLWAASASVPVLSACTVEVCSSHPEVLEAEQRAQASVASLRGTYGTLAGFRRLSAGQKLSEACAEVAGSALRRSGTSFVPPGPRSDSILGISLGVVADSEVRLPGLNTFDVSVNDRCTLCGTCENACPVKAFRMAAKGGNVFLSFYPSQCTGCGICVQECPEDAMEVSKAFSPMWLDFKSFTVKAQDTIECCRRCGREIGPSSGLKKLHDSLAKQGSPALAESVYLCQNCKGSPGP